MLPIAAEIAGRLTRLDAQSALPNAPVLPDPPPKQRRAVRGRVQAAQLLRRWADRVEPARPTCDPG